MLSTAHSNGLSNDSAPQQDEVDEIAQSSPEIKQLYSDIQLFFDHVGNDKLNSLSDQADQMMSELGVTFSFYENAVQNERVLPIDLFPRVISAQDWEFISKGVEQRIKIWNAFFRDIYDSQEILKSGVIPHEIVFNDPQYIRAAMEVPVPSDVYVHVAAFDLYRDSSGGWATLEDHVSDTNGATYALRARHVSNLVVPDLLEYAQILPNDDYPSVTLEHLKSFATTGGSSPRVAILSSGRFNQDYYQHSYLAREMGVPLVNSTDLIVLNSQVFLKTIGGLEKIDVLYRRIEDNTIDPLAFDESNGFGIPGLMNCVRKGTVTIANAVGTGLGNNRAIGSYLAKMARFYFNEPLTLPTISRKICADNDQCEEVLSNLDQYFIYNVNERKSLAGMSPEKIREEIVAGRANFIAEPWLPMDMLPTRTDGQFQQRHCGLRVFGFGGTKNDVYPLALSRYSTQGDEKAISSNRGGGIKDTWILGLRDDDKEESWLTVATPSPRLRLASRIAESLFWTGRYLERAESAARFLRVLNRFALEQKQSGVPDNREPLWEVISKTTGHPANFFSRKRSWSQHRINHYLLFDSENPSSVFRNIENCYHNLLEVRDSVSPEMIFVVTRLYRYLKGNSSTWHTAKVRFEKINSLLKLQDNILSQLDTLTGTASKSLLRSDGWSFLSMGHNLERSLHTLYAIRHIFMRRSTKKSATPVRDDRNLDALLQMLSCRYAYRSLFHSRPAFQNVALLLIQDAQLPRSVLFCVRKIQEDLESVFGKGTTRSWNEDLTSPSKRSAKIVGEIEFANLAPYFTTDEKNRSPLLRNWLDAVIDSISELSVSISDHYLDHQNFRIIR